MDDLHGISLILDMEHVHCMMLMKLLKIHSSDEKKIMQSIHTLQTLHANILPVQLHLHHLSAFGAELQEFYLFGIED